MVVEFSVYSRYGCRSSNTADRVVTFIVHRQVPCAKQWAAPREALSASALVHCLTKDDQTI
jgi:hypothetical protein